MVDPVRNYLVARYLSVPDPPTHPVLGPHVPVPFEVVAAKILETGADVLNTLDALEAEGAIKDVMMKYSDGTQNRFVCVTPAICGTADPMAELRAVAARLKLARVRSQIVSAICDHNGRIALTDLGFLCGWEPPHQCRWNSVRCALNKILEPEGWKLNTVNGHAIANRVTVKKSAKKALRHTRKKRS